MPDWKPEPLMVSVCAYAERVIGFGVREFQGAAAEVAAGSGKRVSGPAQADGARVIHALVDARHLLGREHIP